jgi:SecD/SecF fusion protein
MKPYVVGIVTKDNIKNYFPNKDPLDTTSKADDENIGKNLLLGSNDSKAKTDFGQFEANQLKNSLIGKYNTQLVYQPTIDLAQTPFNGSNGTAKIVSDIDGIKINGSIFSKGIFGTSPLLSCIIALAAVILVIGIIISVLYRIPGFFAFIAGLLTVSLTILFMVLSSHAISFGMLLGVFGGIIITALSVFSFMERIRKHMVKDTVVTSGIKKGIARGILQVLDYHVVGVICGMCFLFFGSITIYELGLTLLLYSLVSVVSFIL